MKKWTILLSLILLSGAAQADTPLRFSGDLIRFTGTARPSAAINILAFYVPAFNYNKKLSTADCVFPEDRGTPTGDNRSLLTKATMQADGTYSMQTPTEGMRGKCPYVLESLYFEVIDGKSNQNLNLLTDRLIEKRKIDYADIGGDEPITDFSKLNSIYCDFNDEYDVGLCTDRNAGIELQYGIRNGPATYELNISDIKDKPERDDY